MMDALLDPVEIAYVEWEDAFMLHDDTGLDDIDDDCILQACGIVVREDDRRIVLCQDYSAAMNTGRHLLSIPKTYIRRIARISSKAMKYETIANQTTP